jgi:hypothetical protein
MSTSLRMVWGVFSTANGRAVSGEAALFAVSSARLPELCADEFIYQRLSL